MLVDVEFAALLRPYLRFAGDEEINPAARLRELGLDSLRAIELLFAVEDAYGVLIPDEKLTEATFETSQALWAVVEELRVSSPDGDQW
jgi:acyl carrier protein